MFRSKDASSLQKWTVRGRNKVRSVNKKIAELLQSSKNTLDGQTLILKVLLAHEP